jgi:hypothetical protein
MTGPDLSRPEDIGYPAIGPFNHRYAKESMFTVAENRN